MSASPYTSHAIWQRIYAIALRTMPATLRHKHGAAMQALYLRELERATEEGTAAVWHAAVSGLWDVTRRSAYEHAGHERAALRGPALAALRSSALAFVVAFVALTVSLMAMYLNGVLSRTGSRAVPDGSVAELVVLSLPFNAALTIPMAVFVAVLWGGTRRSRTESSGSRGTSPLRLFPLLSGAALVGLMAFALNAEVVPRANARLADVMSGNAAFSRNDRSMTLRELRAEAHTLQQRVQRTGLRTEQEQLAGYGVEIHKKPAIAAACVVFALLAAGIARRVPNAGLTVQTLASVVVFGAYYILIAAGESMADSLVVSPAIGMWAANAVLCAVAVVLLNWRRTNHSAQAPRPAVAQ